MPLSEEDHLQLVQAKKLLEESSFAAKATHLLGEPIEKGLQYLPQSWSLAVTEATHAALGKALRVAIATLEVNPRESRDMWHKIAVTLTGAAGGTFGLLALPVELPISTAIMLRSIADIGRAHGEDLGQTETRLACLQVFALGGRSVSDDASATGYFVVRAALAKTIEEAATHIAKNGVASEIAQPIVRLIGQIAARFQLQVSEKVALTAIPVIGAASGALINALFIDHFQNISRGHFTVRSLERQCGKEIVETAYNAIEI